MVTDLWAITCYFNPCRYRTKRLNFDLFLEGMQRQQVNLLVVELAFGEEPFELEPGPRVVQLRGGGVMWQKERLLNIASRLLPDECSKIAWIDNDLLFDDPRWFERTSEALDRYVVVQPFATVLRLDRHERRYSGTGKTFESFGHSFASLPGVTRRGEFVIHGHTGYAWAARRALIDQIGLYDRCLSGSGDHLMAHGFSGGLRVSPCLARLVGGPSSYRQHYLRWAAQARDLVDGKLGYVPGTVLHLWHGDHENRKYGELNEQLPKFDFDPEEHLELDDNGLLDWSERAPPELRAWADEIFRLRREDGDPADENVAALA